MRKALAVLVSASLLGIGGAVLAASKTTTLGGHCGNAPLGGHCDHAGASDVLRKNVARAGHCGGAPRGGHCDQGGQGSLLKNNL